MGQTTAIQWTDHTFNPWIGCAKVSPGCTNCYAEVNTFPRAQRSKGRELWGPKAARHITAASNWAKPLAWNAEAEKEGRRHRVFCASLADVFESHPDLQTARERLWDLIERTPWLDWQLLTKRATNMHLGAGMIPQEWAGVWPRNVWAGVSVEDQRRADERISWLQNVPARVRFLSVEPLLEPIRLKRPDLEGIDWVIIGGESGDRARPCHVDWVRHCVQQCQAVKVAVFVKQLGGEPLRRAETDQERRTPGRDAWPLHLQQHKGGEPAEWPADLRVREFPASALPQSYPNLGATGEG